MPEIDIYTKPTCSYCRRAKQLLTSKRLAFHEIDVSKDPAQRQTMIQRADGRRTVPQIFIGQIHIGGCDDLYALERAGKLDPLLT